MGGESCKGHSAKIEIFVECSSAKNFMPSIFLAIQCNLDYPALAYPEPRFIIEIVGGAGRFYARELLICQLSTS